MDEKKNQPPNDLFGGGLATLCKEYLTKICLSEQIFKNSEQWMDFTNPCENFSCPGSKYSNDNNNSNNNYYYLILRKLTYDP